LFRRLRRSATTDPALFDVGHEMCSGDGCRRRDGTQCSYIDKRSRRCATSWCPNHIVSVAGVPFCRRHASTITALEGSEVVAGLPDLENRAPSLVAWVGADLDSPIRELFTRLAPRSSASLVADPVTLVLAPGGGTRRWAKTWRIMDGTAMIGRISVEVDEEDDCDVGARVDSELVGHGVPPWIERRRAGVTVDPATDAAQRREFTTAMARSIELVVSGEEVVRPT